MPAGTDVHTIEYDETWPVLLKAERTLTYFGKQINNYDLKAITGILSLQTSSTTMNYPKNRDLTYGYNR